MSFYSGKLQHISLITVICNLFKILPHIKHWVICGWLWFCRITFSHSVWTDKFLCFWNLITICLVGKQCYINTNFSTFLDLRYPTNKWIKLGTFHARDERTVQSFPLDEQLYAKYVKVKGCAQMNQSSQSYLIVKFPRNLLISSAHFVARLCPQYSVERKSLRYCQVPDKCS